MNTLKFRKELSKLILSGEKTITWRLFDDKNLSVDGVVSFLVWETKKEFAKAKIISVKETTFGELTDEDLDGHEKFNSDKEIYKTYSKYYKKEITPKTKVKIIKFKLIK